MTRKRIVRICALALILAVMAVYVAAAECSKYQYVERSDVGIKITALLEANADANYITSSNSTIRADYIGYPCITEFEFSINVYSGDDILVYGVSEDNVALGDYLNLRIPYANWEPEKSAVVIAEFTAQGPDNTRNGEIVYFTEEIADMVIRVSECNE